MPAAESIIYLYTDGSCHPQLTIGAWAAIVVINQKPIASLCIAYEATNHQRMEIEAVINGLKYISDNCTPSLVHVVSDSQYVIGLLRRKEKLEKTNFITKANKPLHNSDLIIQFYKLIQTMNVSFEKIKAHQEVLSINAAFNKQADLLCRQAVRDKVKVYVAQS
jgi:ribonuclease HI